MQKIARTLREHEASLKFLVAGGAFVMLTWYATTRNFAELLLLPFLMVMATLTVHNLRTLWLLTAFFVPISLNLDGYIPGATLRAPTDLFCLALLLVTLVKLLTTPDHNISFLRHPIFILIFCWLAWQLAVSVHSEMPVVSFKRVALYAWMMSTFYFLSVMMFSKLEYVFRYFWLIGISFALVLLTILSFYILSGRNPFGLRFNPMPFFDDHTALGAFTSMLVPIFAVFVVSRSLPKSFRAMCAVLLLFILAGLFFSFSRGAWVSAFVGLMGMFAVIYRRIAVYLVVPAVLAAGIWFFMREGGGETRNQAVSRKGYVSHVASITNFKTDDSNAERINRWHCAIEMYRQRPWTGYGPGTYAFVYGDFQVAHDRTLISTNHGDNGTAHNEFLLALSETGIPGFIFTLLLFIVPVLWGLVRYFGCINPNAALLYLGCSMSLLTYGLHAIVNNFLDQDKVFAVFFGMLAVLTALDFYHAKGRTALAEKK